MTAFQPTVIQSTYVEQNARAIAGAILGRREGDVRTLLHTALNKIQLDNYSWSPGALEPDLQFDARDGLQEPVLRRIMVVDEIPTPWEFGDAERTGFRRCVRESLRTIAALDPGMHRSVRMVVAAILFGRLEHFGGGSNSSAIGCVWLNPAPEWTDTDWLENIFHEYVHQCLFLDDMCRGIFAASGEVLADESAQVRSAILEIERPYDRAFHSAFVSFALMQLNLLVGLPGRIVAHIEPLRVTLDQLIDRSHWLTPHGRRVLESLITAFAAFQSANPIWCRRC